MRQHGGHPLPPVPHYCHQPAPRPASAPLWTPLRRLGLGLAHWALLPAFRQDGGGGGGGKDEEEGRGSKEEVREEVKNKRGEAKKRKEGRMKGSRKKRGEAR